MHKWMVRMPATIPSQDVLITLQDTIQAVSFALSKLYTNLE